LLQDVEGNRFHPSHTVKNGKRYRYYFLQRPCPDSDSQSKAIRLPAYDIERQVSLRLQSFLRATNEVMKGLTLPGDPPEITQQLITGAKKQAEDLSKASLVTTRDFIRKVVRRVVVHPAKVNVETSKNELRGLFAGKHDGTPYRTPSQQQEASSHDLILTLEVRLQRCGKEMRLVVSPDSSRPETVTPILKAVARAHKWRADVLSGDSSKPIEAAKRMNLKEETLRRILGCAFLAPDILEAILDGRHPSDLTVRKLALRHFPLDWVEQRTLLGFPARHSRAIP
jgi:hypothetical protein